MDTYLHIGNVLTLCLTTGNKVVAHFHAVVIIAHSWMRDHGKFGLVGCCLCTFGDMRLV
jgi:hypothetical protein